MSDWVAAFRSAPKSRDGWCIAFLALAARLAVVAWAANRFPPADDGHFYQVVAERIAAGLGYTWAWPDGAVTYAAHYPVGYPALLGAVYALFGARPAVAMLLNALLGALGAYAAYRASATVGQRGPALIAGLVAALHPGLVFYTPALMTEGVTAALLAVCAWLVLEARARPSFAWPIAVGGLAGALVLVRPQSLVLAPVFGALMSRESVARSVKSAALVTAMAVAVCLPWTARNCARLDHCAFVSANGGWNLFIGSAEKATGTWVALDVLGVPAECRNEFGEAGKDVCFGRAGLRNVREHPLHFLSLVPKKLGATFDWSGAAGHYLSAANGSAFDARDALVLGIAEALVQRLTLLVGLVGVGFTFGPRRRLRLALMALSAPWLFVRSAWVAYMSLPIAVALLGSEALRRPNLVMAAAVVAATAATHAVFFGAGRYGLVCVLVLVPLIAEAFRRPAFDTF